ncbi:MAG: DUF3990 domain-containing protein [Bacteroidales bacterium]|nr:DUF3990 domain-containing protein [Bacteroidales bacterium]
MKIYHGSINKVETPEIRKPNRTLDYGSGFYTTTSYEQAEAWVRRKMSETKTPKGFVNVYEFSPDETGQLNTLAFESPTAEWLDFVMKNRTQKGFTHHYDIVYGPVANDRVYAAFALYEGGVISREMLINELKAYKLVDQYLFHTPESLQHLRFIKAKEITQ